MGRPRGLLVEKIDPDHLLEWVRENVDAPKPELFAMPFHHYLIEIPHTLYAVVNDEGVGNEMKDLALPIMFARSPMGQFDRVAVPLKRLRSMRTGEMVDLADAIRVFGDRLDGNHWLWYSKAGSPKPLGDHVATTGCGLSIEDFGDETERCVDGGLPSEHPSAEAGQ